MKKLLAANRSEIAIRIFRAASELGLRTVALYSQEDITALHRFKADEAYLIGANKKPIDAYLSIEETLEIALAQALMLSTLATAFYRRTQTFRRLARLQR